MFKFSTKKTNVAQLPRPIGPDPVAPLFLLVRSGLGPLVGQNIVPNLSFEQNLQIPQTVSSTGLVVDWDNAAPSVTTLDSVTDIVLQAPGISRSRNLSILPNPVINLGPDTTLCEGGSGGCFGGAINPEYGP